MRPFALPLSLLRHESARALLARAADRLEEWKDRRSFAAAREVDPVPLVNLLGTPPARRLGGVQTQLLRRLEEEARFRPVALLYPENGGLRLDAETRGRRRSLRYPSGDPGTRAAADDIAFEEGVRELVRRAGARAIHVENPAGLPAGSLARLADTWPLVVSVHDFTPVCPRTDLLEHPALAFCGWGATDERCARCLAADPSFPAGHRRAERDLLAAARAVIFPSDFLRSALAGLPGLDPSIVRVIPPDPPEALVPRPASPSIRRVAFVGAVTVQKGSRVFAEAVRALAPRFPRIRWSALGKGDPAELARLRRAGVRVRGYYRAGTLPQRLRKERVDLALALSVTPESYALAVDECLAAGVPVLAFDHGAPADRLRASGGPLVRPEEGAAG
ncbi:MAG TPA: glycosyltransferase, partial [Thermoanaerobaculia bacterium]|nr:glycosyltransferase [Thermoanaerobaculia bacterium]